MKTKTIVWLLIVCTIILATVEALTIGLPQIKDYKVVLGFWSGLMLISFLFNLLQRRKMQIFLRDIGGGLLLLSFVLVACQFGYKIGDWLNFCTDDVLLLSGVFLVSLYPIGVGVVALYCYLHKFSGWKENIERIQAS